MNHVKINNIESNKLFVTSTPSQPQGDQVGLKLGISISPEAYILEQFEFIWSILSLTQVRYPEERDGKVQSKKGRLAKYEVEERGRKRENRNFGLIYLSLVWIPLGDRSLSRQVEATVARSKLLLLGRSCY